MVDRTFRNSAYPFRTPDIKFGSVRCQTVHRDAGDEHRITLTNASTFIFARKGEWELFVEDKPHQNRKIACGSAIGFENGPSHRWRAITKGELFIAWIPSSEGILKQLPDGVIIVPPTATPSANIFRHAVEIMTIELENGDGPNDGLIMRRCSEITMIEFVRYARMRTLSADGTPAGLAHDEYLLRAWTAYFANPRRHWTVESLAKAAGLGRTVFAERFRRIVGSSPIHTLTRLRLEQAAALLINSRVPLIEIAFTVGYNSEAAFVRAFHREFGQPPGRYRTSIQTK